MKYWILVAEDALVTRVQLTKLIQEAIGEDVEVTSAETVASAIESVENLRSPGNVLAAAVIDVMMPINPGEAPQLAEPLVKYLSDTSPHTLVLFASAYDTAEEAGRMRAQYTSEPGDSRSYFISKQPDGWGDEVVRKLKRHIYGGPIRAELKALFGDSPKCPPSAPASRIGGRLSGIGSRLEVLTYQIRQHYLDLDDDLRSEILRHFEIDASDRKNVTAGLRLTE